MIGSSPRVWGQGYGNHLQRHLPGIIPTRMGTSICWACKTVNFGDHPHAYGDKPQGCLLQAFLAGSSPRVWGQESRTENKKNKNGIIPTRMGTRDKLSRMQSGKRDHPHAYGDKFPLWTVTAKSRGSSPRVWGQGIDRTNIDIS